VWARRSLQSADNFLAAAREMRSGISGGTIALATSHTPAALMAQGMASFLKAFPRVRISVLQALSEQAVQLVRDGKVSVAVTHPPDRLPAEVVALPYQVLGLALVAPVGHPLLRARELTLAKIAAYPLITQHPSRPQSERILGKFLEAGLQVHRPVDSLDAAVTKSYVAAGIGVAIIATSTYSPRSDHGLRIRDAGHLFGPSLSAVLLKRDSHLPGYVYSFLEMLDPSLERRRVEEAIFSPRS
jgi:DNA-binding transcriptional LysR family regulator